MGCICTANHGETPLELLNNLTSLKSTSHGYAKKYRKYGKLYHKLPLHIRAHDSVSEAWVDYSSNSFNIQANDELPDLIQVFDMLEIKFEAARAAVFKGEINMAKRNLVVARGLVEEAEVRVNALKYALEQYEWLSEVSGGEVETAGGLAERASMEQAWEAVLPKCCGVSVSVS